MNAFIATDSQLDQSVTTKRLVFVVGDSVIQHVDEWELKAFYGAKTEDMKESSH